MRKSAYVLLSIAGAALTYLSWRKHSVSLTETLGFLSGAACVWLIVKENIWNWPVGIANNIFFVILFWRARLFADMGLQFVYIVLGFLGWYRWLYGGKEKGELPISRIGATTVLYLAIFIAASVTGLTLYLRSVHDTAPFLDACTSILSICAQYLLTKKIIENWWLWIVTDALSIGLYLYKELELTALLYGIFLAMCITGLVQWKRTLRSLVSNEVLGELSAP
ncbi:MAG: nicotinamide mononucleotide transporter [Acidobacteria bacterium]|nr:nicotinamide mononucleotide transporter [Acidobacteriota bacterium]MBS1865585.1 nicotinamide mononucleotide transporter [Acidobacteriota bacterium]